MNIADDLKSAYEDGYEKGFADGFEAGQRDVQPERNKGEWIDMGDFEQCSVCLGTRLKEVQTVYGKAIWIKTNYCPNCGARMSE